MAKPLTEEQIRDFELFCEETLMNEDDPGYFCLSQYEPFEEMCEDDSQPLFEFHAANHDPAYSHDLYELFASMKRFEVEVHGHDEFWVVPKEA
jgi:hypothetical protein